MHILAERMREHGVEIELHYTGSLKNLSSFGSVARDIRKVSRSFDLTHSQFGSACGYLASYAHGPKVLTLRGTDMLGSDTGTLRNRLHGRLVRWMTGNSLPAYDRVLVASNRMRGELGFYHCRESGVEILPSGIDLNKFKPIRRNLARKQLGISDDRRPWVLFSSVTRNNHVKRPQLAMDVMDLAKLDIPDLTIQTLTGKRHAEVPFWINASNVVLLTSTREGWPNIVKEALACNIPFVSTDVSDLSSIATVESSCHVAPAKPAELAKRLVQTINATRPESLSKHVQHMELEQTAIRLTVIYRSILEPSTLLATGRAA